MIRLLKWFNLTVIACGFTSIPQKRKSQAGLCVSLGVLVDKMDGYCQVPM